MKNASPNETNPTDSLNGSARAIEVVTMLGDSVVGVEHLEPARPVQSRRATLALFVAGALLLAMSAVAFVRGVQTAAANRAALHRLAEIDQLAANEFRPERLNLGWDFLAFGGLAGGIVALGLGLWRVRTRAARTELTAGRAHDVDVALAAVDAERIPLVRAAADRTVLTVAPGMDARLRAGGVATTLADLIASGRATAAAGVAGGWELALPEGGSARLTAGPATFVVRSVPAPTGRLDGLAATIDRKAVSFLAGSVLAHAALLAILASVPPTSKSLALDLGSGEQLPIALNSEPNEDDDQEPVDDVGGDVGESSAGSDPAMSGEEGMAGTPEATTASGRNRVAQRADVAQLSRESAIEMARREGILGTHMAQEFRSLIGEGTFMSGWDKYDQYGTGGRDGNGAGDFGGGDDGNGPGGGGRDDTYKIGNDDLWKYPGPGTDGGVIRLPGHKKEKPPVRISLGEATGPDKETIRRYIRRHLDRIRYLYEKQLLVDPGLSGTVIIVFTISPEGVVLAAKGKGMGGHELEGQIAAVFKSIEFPKTSNGGIIAVSYPINLHSRG